MNQRCKCNSQLVCLYMYAEHARGTSWWNLKSECSLILGRSGTNFGRARVGVT